jgi:hypoxanthine phosphoribosyltransferase
MKSKIEIKSTYLKPLFNPEWYSSIVDQSIETAKELLVKHPFDTIVFSGLSGSAIAFTIAHSLNSFPLLVVRKKEDQSHYSTVKGNLEGNIGLKRYLLVDDFIDTGATVDYIIRSIRKEKPRAQCVAMMMYLQHSAYLTHEHPVCGSLIEVISSRPYGMPDK